MIYLRIIPFEANMSKTRDNEANIFQTNGRRPQGKQWDAN
jgi:hypothetical protein